MIAFLCTNNKISFRTRERYEMHAKKLRQIITDGVSPPNQELLALLVRVVCEIVTTLASTGLDATASSISTEVLPETTYTYLGYLPSSLNALAKA